MTSIILNCYNPLKYQAHMTMACLAAIRKFTDTPYEIIVIDNEPVWQIRDDYHVLQPYTYVVNEVNQNCYACYNQGAKLAKGDKLVFIQSDVFCNEHTIDKLIKYLDKYDVAYPQQIEMSREQIQHIYNTPDGEMTDFGWRDAGMLAITREAFDKSGGWDERYQNILGEKAYYQKIDDAGLDWTCNTNAIITHIMAGNNLSKDAELYDKEMEHDQNVGATNG